MDELIDQIKQQLAGNNINESEVDTIGDLLTKFKTQAITEAEVTAKANLSTLIEEGVKEKTIVLEAQHLEALEKDREQAKLALESEMKETTKALGGRVKMLVERALATHGDRLLQIEESKMTESGKTLLEQINEVVGKVKQEISESQQADPAEIKALKERVAVLENEKAEAKKRMIHEQARANVAETSLKTLRESIDEGLTVTITENDQGTEGGKTQVAEEGHKDSRTPVQAAAPAQPITENYNPEMQHMRRLAGIGKK